MQVPVFVRTPGDVWMVSVTAEVSATGASFLVGSPFLIGAPIEYVLTFMPELTKASRPLLARFSGKVLRCERMRESGDGNVAFSVAVRNTAHRYLTSSEAALFDSFERKGPPALR
jgi:hypothetical protein